MQYIYLIAFTWQIGSTPQFGSEVVTLTQQISTPEDMQSLQWSLVDRITPMVLKKYSKPDMTKKDKTLLVKMVQKELVLTILVPTLLKTQDTN